jgi:hypothetical protein
VTSFSKCTRALTFQDVCQALKAAQAAEEARNSHTREAMTAEAAALHADKESAQDNMEVSNTHNIYTIFIHLYLTQNFMQLEILYNIHPCMLNLHTIGEGARAGRNQGGARG